MTPVLHHTRQYKQLSVHGSSNYLSVTR